MMMLNMEYRSVSVLENQQYNIQGPTMVPRLFLLLFYDNYGHIHTLVIITMTRVLYITNILDISYI